MWQVQRMPVNPASRLTLGHIDLRIGLTTALVSVLAYTVNCTGLMCSQVARQLPPKLLIAGVQTTVLVLTPSRVF